MGTSQTRRFTIHASPETEGTAVSLLELRGSYTRTQKDSAVDSVSPSLNIMPPKKRKFESTFPAARIKKIMQLDDDVGRVASSVPVLISRAVEVFLQALLTRSAEYAASRSAKTLTVGHLKHCIEQEKQWDFLKDLVDKISNVESNTEKEEGTAPKKGRKRRNSQSKTLGSGTKRKKGGEESESSPEEPEGNSSSVSLVPTSSSVHVPPPRVTNPPPPPPLIPISTILPVATDKLAPAQTLVAGEPTLTTGLQHTASRDDEDEDYDA